MDSNITVMETNKQKAEKLIEQIEEAGNLFENAGKKFLEVNKTLDKLDEKGLSDKDKENVEFAFFKLTKKIVQLQDKIEEIMLGEY